MEMYLNYFGRHVKTDDELKTIDILLCADTNDAGMGLTRNNETILYPSKYRLYPASKKQFTTQLENVRREPEEHEDRIRV